MPLQVLFWNRQQHHPLPLQAAPPCGTFTAPSSHAEGTSQQMGARPLQPKTLVLNSKPLPEEGCVIYKVRSGVQGCNQRVLSRWRKEMHGCRSPESTQLLPTSPPTPVPLPCRLGGGALVLVSASKCSLPWFPPTGWASTRRCCGAWYTNCFYVRWNIRSNVSIGSLF